RVASAKPRPSQARARTPLRSCVPKRMRFGRTQAVSAPALRTKQKRPGRGVCVWRRERDSNPRYGVTVHTLSRRAPSTTRSPLHASSNNPSSGGCAAHACQRVSHTRFGSDITRLAPHESSPPLAGAARGPGVLHLQPLGHLSMPLAITLLPADVPHTPVSVFPTPALVPTSRGLRRMSLHRHSPERPVVQASCTFNHSVLSVLPASIPS